MFQPQGTAGLNLKLRLFSNIDPEFYFTPSDTIKKKINSKLHLHIVTGTSMNTMPSGTN